MVKIKKQNKIGALLFALLIFFIMAALAVYPDRYVPSAFMGAKLWAVQVLPSLLPYFFLTALLSYNGALAKLIFKLDKPTRFLYGVGGISAYVQIMSFLSGYPVGAKIIAELYESNAITKREAKKMCAFSSTSGPLFIVGAVGVSMFESKSVGTVLIIAHIASSILNGIIFRGKSQKNTSLYAPLSKSADNILYEAIYSSVISVLIVGGFITVFYCFSQIMYDFKVFAPISLLLSPIIGKSQADAFLRGLIECTGGANMLAEIGGSLSVILTSALIAFGGVSVICQSMVYLKKAEISFKYFIAVKLVQMATSALITAVLLLYFKPL